MVFYTSYFVRVHYRDATTQWRWRSRKLVRGMECQPHLRPRWSRTEDREVRRARARAVSTALYEQDVLGQETALYLHSACLPVRGDCCDCRLVRSLSPVRIESEAAGSQLD